NRPRGEAGAATRQPQPPAPATVPPSGAPSFAASPPASFADASPPASLADASLAEASAAEASLGEASVPASSSGGRGSQRRVAASQRRSALHSESPPQPQRPSGRQAAPAPEASQAERSEALHSAQVSFAPRQRTRPSPRPAQSASS